MKPLEVFLRELATVPGSSERLAQYSRSNPDYTRTLQRTAQDGSAVPEAVARLFESVADAPERYSVAQLSTSLGADRERYFVLTAHAQGSSGTDVRVFDASGDLKYVRQAMRDVALTP